MDRLRRFLVVHRRPVAAGLTVLAVLAGIRSLTAAEPTVDVLVVREDVPSGHVLSSVDVEPRAVPVDAEPDHALTLADLVDRRVAGAMRRGEVLTDRRVLAPRDLDRDERLTMVRLADPAVLVGLRVGDLVDVVATAPDDSVGAVVVAPRAVVAVLPTAETRGDGSAVVGVATTQEVALNLAARSLDSQVSLVVSP